MDEDDAELLLEERPGGYYTALSPKVLLIDVRFEPVGFEKLMPRKALEQPEAPVAPSARRGAKRKDWWDHLWIEMIRRIEAGGLAPKTPAELERIMLDWLATQDEYPGEDTLKRTASNLFNYLQKNGGK